MSNLNSLVWPPVWENHLGTWYAQFGPFQLISDPRVDYATWGLNGREYGIVDTVEDGKRCAIAQVRVELLELSTSVLRGD